VTNRWQARQRKALAVFGLTHVQFVLLASLVWSDKKPLTQKQLAVFTKTDVMMTSQVVRKLEQKGLLTRESSSDDARSFLLQPTPGGITLANKAVRAVEEVDTHFFGILGDDLVDFVTEIQLLAEQD
jgi:DNA-binding MarR family transcriptional regulator